jgi:hypothetical protein
MKIPLIIRSHYYKGLLVISRRDRIIDARERELLIKIGEMLDFDKRFCETAIDDLLSNPHISRSPIIFPNDKVIDCFFRDALRLANVDGEIHPLEYRWLRKTAHANGKSDQWLNQVMQECRRDPIFPLEIQKYIKAGSSG